MTRSCLGPSYGLGSLPSLPPIKRLSNGLFMIAVCGLRMLLILAEVLFCSTCVMSYSLALSPSDSLPTPAEGSSTLSPFFKPRARAISHILSTIL